MSPLPPGPASAGPGGLVSPFLFIWADISPLYIKIPVSFSHSRLLTVPQKSCILYLRKAGYFFFLFVLFL